MIGLILLSILIAAIAGILIKIVFDSSPSDRNISWKEYVFGLLIISLILAPSVTAIGWKVAKSNNLSFNEYWNGWEKSAVWERIPCSRDGPCQQTYQCDPYTVTVSRTVYDDKGNAHTEYTEETRYHDCPYTNEEWTFGIDTTLGFYPIASHTFPDNPQAHRWRSYVSIPQYLIDRVGSGFPNFWSQAKARLDVGRPGPVTKRAQYDNYILASDQTILKQYSSRIDVYLQKKLLPPVRSDIKNFYYADKVQFVGFAPKNPQDWQRSAMYLNSALGTELQGDLHLVIVQNDIISNNPDAYILALKAYWQDKNVFGDNVISKNSIIVVIGTRDGERVNWAKAVTGMPMGNEQMLVAFRNNLEGIPLTPDAVIGNIRSEFYVKTLENGSKTKEIKTNHGAGVIEKIVWGINEPQTKFKRVRMRDFSYLSGEIQPTTGQKIWIAVITFFVCLIMWLVFVGIGERSWKRPREKENNTMYH